MKNHIVIILFIWAGELGVTWVSLFKSLTKEQQALQLDRSELLQTSILKWGVQEGKQQGWKEREEDCQQLQGAQGTSGSCPRDFYTHKPAKNEKVPGFTETCHPYSGAFFWVGGWQTWRKKFKLFSKVFCCMQWAVASAWLAFRDSVAIQYAVGTTKAKGMSLVPSHPLHLSSGRPKCFEHCTQYFPCPLPYIATSHYSHR